MNKRLSKVSVFCLVGLGFGVLLLAGCKDDTQTSEAKGFKMDDDVSFEENDYETIVQANNNLGMDILTSIEPDEQNNTFISPLSLFSALSMAYIGADSETKDEIAKTMHIDDYTDEEIKKGHASLYQLLASMPEEITLHNANALWINNLYETQDDYSETLKKYYNAKFQSADFSDDATAVEINEWIEEQTNEKIKDMITPPINTDAALLLINTLYFQGNWTYPFSPELTEDETFYTDQDEKLVPMMSLSERLLYTENNDYQAVVLPYEDGEVELNVFLPKEDRSLDEMIQSIEDIDWNKWHESLVEEKGTLRLPSFEIEYETSLNGPLQQLGMKRAFQQNGEFPHMIKGNDPLQIASVLQKSVIIVDEEGTEAASATSVEMEVTSAPAEPPFHMVVNRPFLFTITENSSGTVLFMGTVNDPTTMEAN